MNKAEDWFLYMDESMRELFNLSFVLLAREEKSEEKLFDYSFVVFPAAKAYEGFLKKFLWDLGLIAKEDWESDRFRIGRSLNPELPVEIRNGKWVYDDLKAICRKYSKEGEDCLEEVIWKAWKKGRNKVFHYFGEKTEALDLEEAKERLMLIDEAIKMAYEYTKRVKA